MTSIQGDDRPFFNDFFYDLEEGKLSEQYNNFIGDNLNMLRKHSHLPEKELQRINQYIPVEQDIIDHTRKNRIDDDNYIKLVLNDARKFKKNTTLQGMFLSKRLWQIM